MKKYLLGGAALTIAIIATAAWANDEFIAGCEAYADEFDADIDCDCMDEAATENPSLYDEFAKVSKPEDAANMSTAAQEVVAQCSGS